MKKLLIPFVASLLIWSCSKSEIKNVQPSGPGVTHSTARPPLLVAAFTYQYDSHGSPCCKRPWTDCALFIETDLADFSGIDSAIAGGADAVQAFFNGNWQDSFPLLPDDEKLIASLQDGTNTMVRTTNPDGETFYVVVPAAQADHYELSAVVYSVEVPAH